jgi:hypothetical protein
MQSFVLGSSLPLRVSMTRTCDLHPNKWEVVEIWPFSPHCFERGHCPFVQSGWCTISYKGGHCGSILPILMAKAYIDHEASRHFHDCPIEPFCSTVLLWGSR